MRLIVDVKYLKRGRQNGNSREPWRYRRRVPEGLQVTLGKQWFDTSLGTKDEQTAILRCTEMNERVEALIVSQRTKGTERLAYEAIVSTLKSHGLWEEGQTDMLSATLDNLPQHKYEKYVDAMIAESYKLTPTQTKGPLKLNSDPFIMMVKAQVDGVAPPEIHLNEALEVYLQERGASNYNDLKKQVEVAAKVLRGTMGLVNPKLSEVTTDDAYKMRDLLIAEGKAKDTVKKRIGNPPIFNGAQP